LSAEATSSASLWCSYMFLNSCICWQSLSKQIMFIWLKSQSINLILENLPLLFIFFF